MEVNKKIPFAMSQQAGRLAELIKGAGKVKIVSHIDADGISSGAVAAKSLEKAKIPWEIEFVKGLDTAEVERLNKENNDMLWITDLGASYANSFHEDKCVITDHHKIPAEILFDNSNSSETDRSTSKGSNISNDKKNTIKKDLFSYMQEEIEKDKSIPMLNPHMFGIDGGKDLSGSGTTYILAENIVDMTEMSGIAIVGAVGDMQATETGKLTGINRIILNTAVNNNIIEINTDISLYGRGTRTINKMLQYSSDIIIPGISNNEKGAIDFINSTGVPVTLAGRERYWYQLSIEEKRAIMSHLVIYLLDRGFPPEKVKGLWGESYCLKGNIKGTPLYDSSEFATLLNSCGRYSRAETGFNICMGDRGKAYNDGLSLIKNHRSNLASLYQFVKDKIKSSGSILYFHGDDIIPDTIIGIVVGFVLNNHSDKNMPVIGFATASDGMTKVSARAARTHVEKGLNLSIIMKECSEQFGGEGGGHDIAAGAVIPKGKENEFLEAVSKRIGDVVGR